VLGLEPVTLTEWVILLAAACIIVVVMEVFKIIWPKVEKTSY
jgi:hypothetical protein